MSKAKKVLKKATSFMFDPLQQGVGDVVGSAATGDIAGVMSDTSELIAPSMRPPSAPPVAPTDDSMTTAKNKERELARRYSKAGRAGTALSEGSKLG
jgi:hypothetical protein